MVTAMYVKRLFMEDVRILDPQSPEVEVYDPTWDQIESAIRRLDGNHRSIVIIGQLDPETDFMGIGGGKDGVYRCFVYDRQGREFAVIDPSKPPDKLVDILMGQKTSVSLQECIDLDTVLLAAKSYAESGQLEKKLTWKEC
jgi:hypothetical protein